MSPFSEDRAEIVRHDGTITTTLEVAVSPEDDAEVRRVSITNHGNHVREIEVTSYAELVLARAGGRRLRTRPLRSCSSRPSLCAELGAILATRRRRSAGEPQVWAAHLAVVEGETPGDVQFETDRARFLGRGRGIRDARPLSRNGWPLSNTVGAVLDPIFSLRRRVQHRARSDSAHRVLDAGRRVARGGARSGRQASRRDGVRARDDAGLDPGADAASPSRHRCRRGHISSSGSPITCSIPIRRCGRRREILKRGGGAASMLWAHGISGDLPIVLVRIDEDERPRRSSGSFCARTNIGG